ncbi:MAG: sec-independent protein translocase protein TatA [Cellvibrionaceae bacterium]|jgi:sec-independent protein translocase protein TatA
MGIGGIGIGPLLIILLIVVLLFGTKKLKGMGSDLGGAFKGFKKALNDDTEEAKTKALDDDTKDVEVKDESASVITRKETAESNKKTGGSN